MKNLSTLNQEKTMLSTEIVSIINSMREEGAAELRHNDFMAKILKVLGEEVARKFSHYYIASNGKKNPCYALPKREANLMVMSENYKVQAAVYDRMVELENKQPAALDLRDPKQLSVLALQLIELSQEQAKKIEVLEPKAKAIDKLRAMEGSLTITDAAKSLGVKRDWLFDFLKNLKWIFKRSGAWLGYEPARVKGFVDHRPVDAGGKVRTQCVITPAGLSEIAMMMDAGVEL